jgi:hypothetical protein
MSSRMPRSTRYFWTALWFGVRCSACSPEKACKIVDQLYEAIPKSKQALVGLEFDTIKEGDVHRFWLVLAFSDVFGNEAEIPDYSKRRSATGIRIANYIA